MQELAICRHCVVTVTEQIPAAKRWQKKDMYYILEIESVQDFFCKVIKKLIKRIFEKNLQEIMKKNNTWNIRRLVIEMIVPSTQRII